MIFLGREFLRPVSKIHMAKNLSDIVIHHQFRLQKQQQLQQRQQQQQLLLQKQLEEKQRQKDQVASGS